MKNLLYIIKHDRQAAISLLVVFITISVVVVELFTSRKPEDSQQDASEEQQAYAYGDDSQQYAVEAREVKLQPFDPNTADSTVLLDLGLQPWQVRSIYKYRAAGGVYTCPEDFARLYGLSVKKYRELRPYIRIAEDYRPASDVYRSPDTRHQASATHQPSSAAAQTTAAQYPQKLKPGETIALSSADTASLQHVPGIGPYFARRIVKYREQLGGFVSKEQLLEIQDFPESALQYLSFASTPVRRLNVNKASAEQLRNHPYITYAMAREILNYRRLRGTIQNISDLSLLPSFNKETIAKLSPYIEY